MNRRQQAVIDYLLEENRILKEQFDLTGKKLRLDNRQRRELAKRGKAMSWSDLQSYAGTIPPATARVPASPLCPTPRTTPPPT
jgi:hypothetical protein